ncbi:MAG TPA: hypothetical protein VMS76_01750 [Planctomycetota bacterium]|nr:hypothetical protein [Planctomycetota bacterium]
MFDRKILLFASSPPDRLTPGENTGGLWELRSIPGNLISVALTEVEAKKKLIDLVEWTRSDEPDFADWHEEALSDADAEDRKKFDEYTSEDRLLPQWPRLINPETGYVMIPDHHIRNWRVPGSQLLAGREGCPVRDCLSSSSQISMDASIHRSTSRSSRS